MIGRAIRRERPHAAGAPPTAMRGEEHAPEHLMRSA